MVKETSRLEALEAALAEQQAKTENFEAEIAALKAQMAPPAKIAAKPPVDEGTRVFAEAPTNNCFVAPTPDELHRLCEAVLRKYPVLRPSNLDDEFESAKFAREFANTFAALSLVRRAEAVDTKRALWAWVDHLNEVGKAAGLLNIDGSALYVAAIAHSDIPFSDPSAAKMGVARELGLQFYGSGRRATNCWERTLHGRILAPIVPASSRNYPTPGVRIGSVA
jgi:hypothetical protein